MFFASGFAVRIAMDTDGRQRTTKSPQALCLLALAGFYGLS
jgi:hypothetical protein